MDTRRWKIKLFFATSMTLFIYPPINYHQASLNYFKWYWLKTSYWPVLGREVFQNFSLFIIYLFVKLLRQPQKNICFRSRPDEFFSKWGGRYPDSFFSCLSSYGLMLNIISAPFVFVLSIFTFIASVTAEAFK